MIRQFLELPPFIFISMIVQGQLAVTAGLSVVIAVMLTRRNRRQAWTESRRVRYAEMLVDEMLQGLEGTAGAPILRAPLGPANAACSRTCCSITCAPSAGSSTSCCRPATRNWASWTRTSPRCTRCSGGAACARPRTWRRSTARASRLIFTVSASIGTNWFRPSGFTR